MADASNVRHDTIVVPDTMSPAQVRALAERKAQAQVGDDNMFAFGPATGVPGHNQCTELIADWITAVTASGWEISVRCDPPL
jgi:hypothetical protein